MTECSICWALLMRLVASPKIGFEGSERRTSLAHYAEIPIRENLPVRRMRDWVFDAVGREYELTLVGDRLRVYFADIESALLFKITFA